ncbi:MAG: Mur ligase family protein [Chromatiales bacterium]|nr:Mur ligase family protein [Chromatiales bacterium]
MQPGDLFFAAARRAAGTAWSFWTTVQGGRSGGGGVGAALAMAALPTDAVSPLLAAPELRQKLGVIAGRFYGEPSRRLQVVGITGTDGKTSCAHFIAQALSDAESGPCGISGYVGRWRLRPDRTLTAHHAGPAGCAALAGGPGCRGSAVCSDGSVLARPGSGPGERGRVRGGGV